MRIAVFDYRVIATNPVGSCHLRLLQGLCQRHDFTVFAVEFENPCPQRIRWVRIPLLVRPYVLLYALYHIVAPLVYAWQWMIRGARYDLVQIVESNLLIGDVSYSHFCHRRYLDQHWRETPNPGLRGFARGLAHRAAALLEPWVYRRVDRLVVPSRGLSAELAETYPKQRSKLYLLPNPVDIERLRPPDPATRSELRARLGIGPDETALLFVALGHFERKGLPLILESLRRLADPRIRLMVVGGQPGLIAEYRRRVEEMRLESHVNFEGMQTDLGRYYWSADAFIFPSCYEVFPLVALEAAAAGLPLLATRVNGVAEMLDDSDSGLVVERTVESVSQGIRRWLTLTGAERRAMSRRAREIAEQYSVENFVAAWRRFYELLA